MKLEPASCWTKAGGKGIPGVARKVPKMLPAKSPEKVMKSVTSLRADGQYFQAHCPLMLPCDHPATETFRLPLMPEM